MIYKIESRLLRKNHKASMPGRYLCLDVETKKRVKGFIEYHRLDVAWTCYTRRRGKNEPDTVEWKLWEKTYPYCQYIESLTAKKSPLYLFGHNIFFDLQCSDFFFYFTKWGWVLDFVYEAGLIYILCIEKDDKKIRAISTTNYFDVSLKKLGEILGLEKMTVDFENVPRGTLIDYCKQDVEIVKAAVKHYMGFIQANDLGRFCYSRSGQALAAYRHRFMSRKIYIHSCHEVKQLERMAYFGGRVECYSLGIQENGPFVTVDINSAYPSIMSTKLLPSNLLDYQENVKLSTVESIMKRRGAVAEAVVKTDTPLYAYRSAPGMIYPVGKFTTYLCTEGLRTALERGDLLQVKRIAVYQMDDLFKDYVEHFYSLRLKYKQEGNQVMSELCKVLLNSLSGKWGQKKPIIEEQVDLTCDGYYRMEVVCLDTGEVDIEYKLFNKKIYVMGSTDANKSFVAIAAHITEHGRFALWRIIEKAGIDNVLYCDTDSIKMRSKDLHTLKDMIGENVMGKLRVESTCNYLDILGNKSYITEDGRKLAGIPAKAQRVEDYTYRYAEFSGQKSQMTDQIMRSAVVHNVQRKVSHHYAKGQVTPSGRILPFELVDA